ncbi:S-layer homology domain-containing protein [Neobacillus sp. YIM B06451]|uniref:S-layer homology domain-containing protein n=1 Tax=Neobacillus sp. YIM B06451 TaxID=3070994 RepID=UPI002931DB32|nr:S-layer homology domain-containing protein [Neobacillus sp. YIM B06451]
MNFKKLLLVGALSCSLILPSFAVVNNAYAVEFADTSGSQGETSINKLVSLGVIKNPGDVFDPEGELTRIEFAYIVNQVMSLGTGKKVAFKDLSSKNSNYTNTLKLVNNGYLSLSKGNVEPQKGVTYAEMSKALAQGLGLKKAWTNRPIDFLFYLVRKDVLDIDVDLDEVVTREAAAVAFDKFITLKGNFTTDEGVVVAVSEKGFTLNNGSDTTEYTFASNISLFVGDQAVTAEDVQVGSPATVILNKNGQAAFYAGEILDAEEGALKVTAGKWNIGTFTKDMNLNAFVASLPNSPTQEFTIKLITEYLGNGAEFGAQAFFTKDDEVTGIYPFISKVTNKDIAINGKQLTVTLTAAYKETFTINDEVKVTLDGKEAKLEDLKGALTATITAEKFGSVLTIDATTKK